MRFDVSGRSLLSCKPSISVLTTFSIPRRDPDGSPETNTDISDNVDFTVVGAAYHDEPGRYFRRKKNARPTGRLLCNKRRLTST